MKNGNAATATKPHKIIIIGDANVGKTSILNRLTKDTFDQNVNATMGAGFKTKDIQFSDPLNGQALSIMRLSIWDTVGQEKFDSLTKLYFNNTEAAIVVYDVCDEQSFERVKKWMKELEDHEQTS